MKTWHESIFSQASHIGEHYSWELEFSSQILPVFYKQEFNIFNENIPAHCRPTAASFSIQYAMTVQFYSCTVLKHDVVTTVNQ